MDRVPCGIVLVGPNVLLREGLTRILSAADFRILASAYCVDDVVLPAPSEEQSIEEQSILLIIDVSDDFDAAVRQIEFFKKQYPFARVTVLAHHHQLAEMISAFRAGANAYFVKVAADTFIKSLELVMLGETILPSAILTLMLDQRHDGDEGHYDARRRDHNGEDACHDEAEVVKKEIRSHAQASLATEIRYAPRLSDRQRTILGCLLEGDSNKTIARKMAIAEATVKVHVKAILRKIRVHNRTQAAIWAMNNSLFSPAKYEGSSAAEDLVVRSSPARHAAQVLSAGQRNGSALLPAFKIEGPSHGGALPSIDGFIRKGIIRKNE